MTVVTGRKRPPRRITAQYLDRAALAYLQRFASSAENLRRVLLRRVDRAARVHGDDPAEGERQIEALIERYSRAGLLDDQAYAAAKVDSLRRRGDSRRTIQAKLAAKGIGRELAVAALDDVDSPRAELAAAIALAKRRRLGPYRTKDRLAVRDKDLAALARAGFSYEVAKQVVDATDPIALLSPDGTAH